MIFGLKFKINVAVLKFVTYGFLIMMIFGYEKLYLLILCAFTILNNCKKDAVTVPSVVGEWELRTAINGMTGMPTNYSPGNGTILKFTKTSYENYSGGNLVRSGNYKIVKDVSGISKEVFNRILYDNENQDNSVKIFFNIENNKLSIWPDAYDAPASIYEKKK